MAKLPFLVFLRSAILRFFFATHSTTLSLFIAIAPLSPRVITINLFFGILGDNFDGNNFINESLSNGASFAVTSNKKFKIIY